jgi:hypothetical protein
MAEVKDDGKVIVLFDDNINCNFDKATGRLISMSGADMKLGNCTIDIDIGCDGEFKWDTLSFQELDNLHTWEVPAIVPKAGSDTSKNFMGFDKREDTLVADYQVEGLHISILYSLENGAVRIGVEVFNNGDHRRVINGVAFEMSTDVDDNAEFEFPGNVPHNIFKASDLQINKVIQSGQIAAFVHTYSEGGHYNVVFLGSEEKWSTGVFRTDHNRLKYINLAAVESYLAPGQTLYCGDMFVQLIGKGNPYLAVRELYAENNWVPPSEGINDGVMYSCHPSGTMDSGFPLKRDLFEYAEELEELKDLGIDHIWLLPIFVHDDRGVYHPGDMSIIDERYGGDDGVKYFSKKLHDMGMTLLFDFVPHGPSMDDEFAKQHMQWAAVDREGHYKTEWDCLSFDMANPEYQRYITQMVKTHIERFDINGSRIDCAMGGLSNWNPYPGNRPSCSNLKGGVSITRAIRDAFIQKGKKPLILPENFNPLPFYYPYTDVFYDMPLYRVLMELDESNITDEEYVRRLTHWLEAEMLSTPQGLIKLRFLGNHDTVSWTWQARRAVDVYGVDKAKALWALISFIDGMPMIYQGDEDPSIYGGHGPELRGFFKGLFKARKQWLGNQYDVSYIYTNTSIMAFKRSVEDKSRLILINLSPDVQSCELDLVKDNRLVYGSCEISDTEITMDGYGYAIIDIRG